MPRVAPLTSVTEIQPYGEGSEHSWLRDSAVATLPIVPDDVRQRLNRSRWLADRQERAVGTGTLGGLIPATIEPWVSEAVSYGVRSGAPLAAALERLDLPPVGMNVAWAKVSTGATVTNQTAENAAVTASADPVVASATDPIQTIAAYVDFSAQAQELSGGWFDQVIGYELGVAFAARLESQLWIGTGASGQIKGFTVMTGNSSSTVSGQTSTLFMNKLYDQYQQVTTNLGMAPDLLALAPRRYAMLGAAAAALGLDVQDVIPDELQTVVSPAAPVNLGGGTNEDWALILNKASTPLVKAQEPTIEFHREGPGAGTTLLFRWLIYAYVALGVSRRPEGVGLVKGATTPTFT